jgi:hypothetical protein
MSRKDDDTPNAFLNGKRKSFVGKYCDLGNETSWWIKDGDENSWQKRAPYFLLDRGKKGWYLFTMGASESTSVNTSWRDEGIAFVSA